MKKVKPKLKDKVVVITGASSGIGKALAYCCAKNAANLVLASRSYVDQCNITADLEKKYNIRAVAVNCDVTIKEDCQELIRHALLTFKKIDVLICNAGKSMRGLFVDTDLKVFDEMMKLNYFGSLYCMHYALPHLLENKGSIIGISSVAGIKGLPGRSGYCASKFALNGLLDSIRIENLKKPLHVLTVMPGFTASNIRKVSLNAQGETQSENPLKESKLMSAEKVAKKTIHALIKRKQTLVMTQQGKSIALIMKFFPQYVNKRIFNHFKREKFSLLK